MDIEQRVLTCRLIEKIDQNPTLGRQLGLKDVSRYRGKLRRIDGEGEKNYGKKNEKRLHGRGF